MFSKILQKIPTNQWTNIVLIIATIGGFVADYFQFGYGWVAAIVVIGLVYAGYDEYKTIKFYDSKNLPIPIVINISNPASSMAALESIYKQIDIKDHRQNLEKYFNIIDDDLIFKYDADIFNEDRFIDFLKILKHDITQLGKRVKTNINYQIAYIGPIANAIAVGTVFGTDGLTIYQYNKSSDSYTIAIDIKDRNYKEKIAQYEVFDIDYIGTISNETQSVTVAIDASSHQVALNQLNEPIIHLKSMLGATMLDTKDFIQANREIYQTINKLQNGKRKIRLAYSMPTSIGFLLGMSIQVYWNIELTQYSQGKYKPVIRDISKINYFF